MATCIYVYEQSYFIKKITENEPKIDFSEYTFLGSFFPDGAGLYTKWTGLIGDAGARLKKLSTVEKSTIESNQIVARLTTHTVYLCTVVGWRPGGRIGVCGRRRRLRARGEAPVHADVLDHDRRVSLLHRQIASARPRRCRAAAPRRPCPPGRG